MMSREAIRRGYNRRNYIVGAHTPPAWASSSPDLSTVDNGSEGSLQFADAVLVDTEVVDQLEQIVDTVTRDLTGIVVGTRDWWARTKIAETGNNPAITRAVIVTVSSVEQIQAVMRLADERRIPVTVSAGRSNVTGAALPLAGGIVLDVLALNSVLEFDPISQIIEVEAGLFGDVFEEHIQSEYGMTMGHWPSSFGISTVGGWVACRGAGQLSTRYGKIEDMVAGLEVVLADGRLVSLGSPGRAAVGSDLQQLFIGSEGTLGVITKVKFKLHRLPEQTRALAYGFPSFAVGLDVCREILQRGATPAALRLYDALESGVQFDLPEQNVLLIADEGESEVIDAVMTISADACEELGGVKLDENPIFERWLDTRYLTGKSAEGFKESPGFVADTLEMIGPWDALPAIYDEVVDAIAQVEGTLAGSAHQSHAYVDSACLYFSLRGTVDPDDRADWYQRAWDAANAVIIKHGATLSHHHGVGLLRSRYMEESLGAGFEILKTIKQALDPQNILNPGKLGL
ncbi:FAD-binding oxidoreductase [Brevibacterium aurantiacum]|uniref:FAD-binding oxidoreductase n=1 Tax=Brevibacterium aurantiacum TaxID=273384 RepID=A0A556CD49_BREAU|nr:FAD-binding oxidoreductase [Brevibacterium aurantiacum]TSI15365.1 FAD-binding oxidoreductase [Brevibacterium aurantiacum]